MSWPFRTAPKLFRCQYLTDRAMAGMVVFTVHMPPEYVEALQQLVDAGFYSSVAEAIRMAVRDLIMRESRLVWWRRPAQEARRAPDGELVAQAFKMPKMDMVVLRVLSRKGHYVSVSEAVREAAHDLVRLEKDLLSGARVAGEPYVGFSVHLAKHDYTSLRKLVSAGAHVNMSDALRTAVRFRVIQESDLL